MSFFLTTASENTGKYGKIPIGNTRYGNDTDDTAAVLVSTVEMGEVSQSTVFDRRNDFGTRSSQ